MSRFLRVFAIFFGLIFAGNAFAAGYTCDSLKTYTSCNAGYYMSGTTCTACPSNSTTSAGNTSTSCTCTSGYTVGGTPSGSTTTTTTACTAIATTITLNGNGATTAGTTAIYGQYNAQMLFLDSARSQAMASGSGNAITAPSRVHTVTYNANGGTVTTSSATATFTFNGYYSANSNGNGTGTQYIGTSGYPTSAGYSAGAALNANATWYAQWTGGSVTLPTPTKAGCKFNGWSTSSTATSGTTGSYTPTSNVTLYATWACMSISAGTKALTYNGSAQSCANVTAPTGATITYSASSGGTYDETEPTLTDFGSKTVYYKVSATGYTDFYGSYFCAMQKASSTITVKEGSTTLATGSTLSLTYPTAKSLSVTCSNGATPTASGDTTAYVTVSSSGSTVTLTPAAVGNGTIVTISCPATTNYLSASASYTVNVANGTITISGGGNKTLTYNGTTTSNGTAQSCANVTASSPSDATVTYSTSSGGTYSATAPTLTNVGSTTVYYKVAKDNYTTKTGNYTCTMGSKAMTVSASNKSKVYDGSALTCSITVTTPTSGATIKYGTASGTYNLTSAPTQTNVGSQTVYYQVTGDNFTTKTGSFTCSVTKATMDASLAGNSKTYDGTALTCNGGTQTGVPSGSTITYGTSTSSYSSTIPTVTNVADSKTIYYKITNSNYNDFTGSFSCTVSNATMTVSASNKTLTYTGSAQSCGTVSVSVPSSGATVKYGTTNGSYTTTSAITKTDAGTYTIYYQVTATNYTTKTGSFTCTVDKAANTLTLSASSGNMAYSTTKTFTVSNNTSGGALSVATSNSDVATATISGTTVTITSKTGYGSADITVTSAATSNYNSASAKYTITVDLGTITLNNQSANTAGTTAIYQKYNTNVYLDSARSKAMTASANPITIPKKSGVTFKGYYSATSGGTQYINANGYITSDGLTAGKALKANGTWYAQWSTCPAGSVCNGSSVTTCPEGSFCPEGSTSATKCPGLYVNSAAGSDADTDCYFTTTAGKYMVAATDTAQTTCPVKQYCTAETLYYPNVSVLNDGGWNDCPAISGHQMTTIPDNYRVYASDGTTVLNTSVTIYSAVLQSWTKGMTAVTSCRAVYGFQNEAGIVYDESVKYNASTGKYDIPGSATYYSRVNQGYYVKERYSATRCDNSSSSMIYKKAVVCPAGSYCPGLTNMPLCSSGISYTDDGLGKYSCADETTNYASSAEKSTSINSCYLTTGTGNFVKTANAAQETCTCGGYCPGSVTVYYGSTGGKTDCAAGKYNSATGSSASSACKTTDAGYYAAKGSCSQTAVSAGRYTAGGATTANGDGAVNAGYYNTGCGTNATGSVCSTSYSGGTIAAGRYGAAGATTAQGSGAVNAGYYSTGGGTSATPTKAGTGCISSKECGPIAAGHYGAAGATTAQGSGAVNAGYYSTGGGTSATPTAAGNGCLSSYACGKVTAGCYTTSTGSTTACPNECPGDMTSAAGSDAKTDCKITCTAGNYLAAGGSTCSTCTKGNYCANDGTYNFNASSNQGIAACSSLSGVSVSGGSYTSVAGSDASTDCKYTAPAPEVPTYCATKTSNTVTYSGTAWPTSTYSVTAKAGSIISGNNTATATCSQCTGATYSAGGTATTCSSCDSNYQANTTAGKSLATQCQISCGAGQAVLEKNAACAIVTGNNYKTGTALVNYGSTSPTASDKTSGWAADTIYACPSSYSISGTATTNHDARTDCTISCAKGTQVVSANVACTTPSGTTWYTAAHSVSAGSTSGSNVKSCNTGYATANTTTVTDHDEAADCKIGCSAGYYIPTAGEGCKVCTAGKYCSAISGIAQTSTSAVTGNVTAGYWNNGCGTNATGSVCSTSYSGGTIAAGYYGGAGATSSTGSGTVSGGYYSTGGGTSATPTSAGTGCLSSFKCGKLSAAYYSNGGSTADGATCVSGKTCGTCDSNYRANTATGKTAVTQCETQCAAGTAVLTANNACATIQNSTYKGKYTAQHNVAYGSKSDISTCPTYYQDGNGAAGQANCINSCAAGTQVASANADCTTPNTTNWYTDAHDVTYGKTSANLSKVIACDSDYANSGDTAASHAGVTSCKVTCAAGTYVASNGAACTDVGSGYYRSGTETVSQTKTGTRNACTDLGAIYKASDAGRDASTDCYATTTAKSYVKTEKDATETSCPAGSYCPGSVKVYYNSTGGSTLCPAGKFCVAGVSAGTECVLGSYSAAGASACTACQDGKTTSAKGATSCNATCSNATGVSDWETASWATTNTMTNLCTIAATAGCSANYYKNSNACSTCSSGTNSKYTLSAAGTTSVNSCYLKTTEGKYVATKGAGETACISPYYCPGGTTIYYGTGTTTGGNSTCTGLGAIYKASDAGASKNTQCYATTSAGKYVTAKATSEAACPAGDWCAGSVKVYYGSAGGNTDCPSGYTSGTTGYSAQSQCLMSVAGGKYVATEKESSASGTCAAGYYKPAHTVNYGGTSSCSACTGATYQPSTGQASCLSCPAATNDTANVSSYSYWNGGSTGDHTVRSGCNVTFKSKTLDDGVMTAYSCYVDTGADTYGIDGTSKTCWVNRNALTCNGGYYNSTFNNSSTATQYTSNKTLTDLYANVCQAVGTGYYSANDALTRTACSTGLVTCGSGACANEADDCGRKLHMGANTIYLRSAKRGTPALNVKIGDKTFYGVLSTSLSSKAKVKNGTTTYSVVNDNQ